MEFKNERSYQSNGIISLLAANPLTDVCLIGNPQITFFHVASQTYGITDSENSENRENDFEYKNSENNNDF